VDRVLYEYSPSNKELVDHLNKCAPLYSNCSVARHSLTSVVEQPPRRELLSESLLKQHNLGTSLHGNLDQVEECSLAQKLQKPIDDDRYDDADDSSSCQESTVSTAPTSHLRNILYGSLHNKLSYSQKGIGAQGQELVFRMTLHT
jgi:arylamine N-acetyltransferase